MFPSAGRKALRRRHIGRYVEEAQRRERRSGARTFHASFGDTPLGRGFVAALRDESLIDDRSEFLLAHPHVFGVAEEDLARLAALEP